MIRLVPAGAAGQPKRWVLAFARETQSRWVRFFAWGKYKHVSAFGYVVEMDCWVFFDLRFRHVDVIVARGDGARFLMDYYAKGADLLGIAPSPTGRSAFRIGFWCVPAIKHLIGLRSGALRPDSLWRDCIRQGAQVLSDENAEPAAVPSAAY